jgi:hypothetical protein
VLLPFNSLILCLYVLLSLDAWKQLMAKRPDFLTRNAQRAHTDNGDMLAFGLSGAHFIGFGHPVIHGLLERLPGSALCRHYRFRYQRADSPRTRAKRLAASNTDDDLMDSDGIFRRRATYKPPQRIPLPVLAINTTGCLRSEGWVRPKKRTAEKVANQFARTSATASNITLIGATPLSFGSTKRTNKVVNISYSITVSVCVNLIVVDDHQM